MSRALRNLMGGTTAPDKCCPSGQPVNCAQPQDGIPAGIERGVMPIVIAICPDDTVTQPGRIDSSWVPRFVAEDVFQRGATFSPITPLQATGTYVGPGALALSLAFGAPPGTPAQRALIPGVIIDLMTSNNVAPGITTADFTGTFENGLPWTQQVQFSTMATGTSRFIVLASREVQGGAYPQLVVVDNGSLVGETVADVQSFAPVSTLGVSFQSVPGTSIRIEGLSPVSKLWYQALAMWNATRRMF